MSYKTILVHADQSLNASARYRLAAALAANDGAHLIGVAATGVSRYIYPPAAPSGTDPALGEFLKAPVGMMRERARAALDDFERQMKSSDGVVETLLVDDEPGEAVSVRGRYSDLVVIGQFNVNDPAQAGMSDFPEYVVFNSGRPVIVVPYTGAFDNAGSRVLVAWDGSVGATRAVTAAIPILRRASAVQVAVFNAATGSKDHGEEPGADIALYLARHGIQVEVTREESGTDIGNAILSLAADLGSDMIVMGCYGHTRFREMLLGGATRTVLQSMTVPVLMAH